MKTDLGDPDGMSGSSALVCHSFVIQLFDCLFYFVLSCFSK